MNKRVIFCYVILMAFLSWVSVPSRPFPSDDSALQQDQNPQPPLAALDSNNGLENESIVEGKATRTTTITTNGSEEEEDEYRALSRLGSRPPNCGHKCGGCFPCEPVQTPAITDRIGLQIANYEPEGWKCKCGLSFFNP